MSIFGAGAAGLDLFHVGIVVPDIEAAIESYGSAFGFHWTAMSAASAQEVLAEGVRVDTVIRACYSIEGPPYVELIEDVTGNVWGDDAYGLNHTGFWAEDIDVARARLERSGLPALIVDAGAQPPRYSYHRASNGMWVELVGPGFRPRLLERVRLAQESLAL